MRSLAATSLDDRARVMLPKPSSASTLYGLEINADRYVIERIRDEGVSQRLRMRRGSAVRDEGGQQLEMRGSQRLGMRGVSGWG